MRVFSSVLALAALALATPTFGAETGEEAPVLLRDVLVLPPPEATGTGLAPEVRVRVSIDERGRVSEVECLTIEPPSPLDEVFKASVRAQLLDQRYAPARRDGQAVATRLEWTVKFQPRLQGATDFGSWAIPLLPAEFTEAEFRQQAARQFARIPVARQKELLLQYAAVAESHLIKRRRQQFESPNFLVITDAEDSRTAEWAAANLEAALAFLDQLWRTEIEPLPRELRVVVYLYGTHDQYVASERELAQRFGQAASYMSPGLVRYYLELPSVEYLLSVLIHETCHAYSDNHLLPPGVGLPEWLEEGFAEYVANSEIKKGRLEPGRVLKRRFVFSHDRGRAVLATTVAGDDARALQAALRRKNPLKLEQLLTLSYEEFYGEQHRVYYAASWVLVHFLRHGRPGWEALFPKMMLYVAEGYPIGEALPAVYGVRLTDLEDEFRRYAKKF